MPQSIKILKAEDVVQYLTQVKGAVSLVSDYLANLERDIEMNVNQINQENNTNE